MDTGVPIIDQLREALQAEPRDEFLINFLRSERNVEIYFARKEVLKSRLKAVRKQNTDSFPSILKVFKVALSGCLGSCLLLQFTTQLENESCASDFCSINVQPPSDSDLCRLDSMDSYSHSEPLDSIDSYLPHSSTEGIRHRLKIR